jgi:hypothetical protein
MLNYFGLTSARRVKPADIVLAVTVGVTVGVVANIVDLPGVLQTAIIVVATIGTLLFRGVADASKNDP